MKKVLQDEAVKQIKYAEKFMKEHQLIFNRIYSLADQVEKLENAILKMHPGIFKNEEEIAEIEYKKMLKKIIK